MWVRSLGQGYPPKKEMATHSSILAWQTPWTKESCWLQSLGSQKVGHDWARMYAHVLSEKIRRDSVSIHEIFSVKEFMKWVTWYPVAASGAENKWDTGNINYGTKEEDGNMVTRGDAWKNTEGHEISRKWTKKHPRVRERTSKQEEQQKLTIFNF